jgi:hypothetical protein
LYSFGLILLIIQVLPQNAAQAKFGDSIDTFRQKMASHFRYINTEKKNTKAYYHFAVNTDNKIRQADSGFAGGLTISTDNGKITGESLLVQLGTDNNIGKKLAAILCLNLAYDALGKPIPAADKDKQSEYDAYFKAVNDAMSGQPGHIGYPGYSSQLLFSQTNEGSFLFVINPAPPAKPPLVKH